MKQRARERSLLGLSEAGERQLNGRRGGSGLCSLGTGRTRSWKSDRLWKRLGGARQERGTSPGRYPPAAGLGDTENCKIPMCWHWPAFHLRRQLGSSCTSGASSSWSRFHEGQELRLHQGDVTWDRLECKIYRATMHRKARAVQTLICTGSGKWDLLGLQTLTAN